MFIYLFIHTRNPKSLTGDANAPQRILNPNPAFDLPKIARRTRILHWANLSRNLGFRV